MEINLQELNYKDKLSIDTNIPYNDEYLKDTDIIHLNNVHVSGEITKDIEFNFIINFKVTGEMIIPDSLTNDEVPYKFTINIEENLQNSLKVLDLIEFLWHYIVLEIPLRYTISEIDNYENDDYRLISEEEYKNKNNPFKDFFVE